LFRSCNRGMVTPALSLTSPNAEYRRTLYPQANATGARLGVANFAFPGIMGRTNRSKDNKNGKVFR